MHPSSACLPKTGIDGGAEFDVADLHRLTVCSFPAVGFCLHKCATAASLPTSRNAIWFHATVGAHQPASHGGFTDHHTNDLD